MVWHDGRLAVVGSAPGLILAKCIDKQVDHANRDAVVNEVLEAFGQ
jgi:hypothetical protein